MNEKKKSKLPLLLLAGVGAGLFAYQLNHVVATDYVIENDKIPPSFDGFRILQISDFHNNGSIIHDGKLAKKIRALTPDVIFITGDIADDMRTDFDTAVRFARDLASFCEVYYVPGNHEAALRYRDILFRQLEYAGVKLLFDRGEEIRCGGDTISVSGVMDPHFDRFRSRKVSNNMRLMMRLRNMKPTDGRYHILLSHRPEHLTLYSNYGYDLVFAGHAHGGQWRVPSFGGLYAPGQGILPEYSGGVYQTNGTTMVVSRGLGNSVLPLRINNPYELVLVTLKSQSVD